MKPADLAAEFAAHHGVDVSDAWPQGAALVRAILSSHQGKRNDGKGSGRLPTMTLFASLA